MSSLHIPDANEPISNHLSQEELLRLERDIQIARRIQENFLPRELPQPAGWQIAAAFHPAREVAGDFYDVFMLTQNRRIGLVIADVCDKGVGAALFMSLSRSLLRAFAQQHYTMSGWANLGVDSTRQRHSPATGRQALPSVGAVSLKNAITLTNAYILENHIDMNMFVTLFFGVLDPNNGTLLYVNAGHDAPFIIGNGEIKERLTATGPAVGILPDAEFGIAETNIAPGDMLYCYTDGVTDARSPTKAFFGKEQLCSLVTQPYKSATHLLTTCETHLEDHIASAVQFDDITMLAVHRLPALPTNTEHQ